MSHTLYWGGKVGAFCSVEKGDTEGAAEVGPRKLGLGVACSTPELETNTPAMMAAAITKATPATVQKKSGRFQHRSLGCSVAASLLAGAASWTRAFMVEGGANRFFCGAR